MTAEVERYTADGGTKIYRLRLELFPGFLGYSHLVIADGLCLLIDVGSGLDESNSQLEAGLQRVETDYEERCAWSDLTHVLISHGHIDHFGGLPFVRSESSASIGVHELDRPVLTHYEERLTVAGKRLTSFLHESGIPSEKAESLMEMYHVHKHLFRSLPVDFTFTGMSMDVGPLQVVHVPGHCPGQVVLRIHDILFSADHVLEGISPHQAPERLMPYTGLGHYLESLAKLEPWSDQIRLALGGHEGPVRDLPGRIAAIKDLHGRRLVRAIELLDQPRTLAEVAHELFLGASGYHELLALEETGAHLEFLEQRGFLSISNQGQWESGEEAAPRYVASLGSEELQTSLYPTSLELSERNLDVQL